jgi:hypothetical protein
VIVVMKPDATAEQVDHMVAHILSLGMSPQVLVGTQRTVIAAIGDERQGLAEVLEPGEGVDKVLPILAPYKRASSELTTESRPKGFPSAVLRSPPSPAHARSRARSRSSAWRRP